MISFVYRFSAGGTKSMLFSNNMRVKTARKLQQERKQKLKKNTHTDEENV